MKKLLIIVLFLAMPANAFATVIGGSNLGMFAQIKGQIFHIDRLDQEQKTSSSKSYSTIGIKNRRAACFLRDFFR